MELNKYMVIAVVDGTQYLVSVQARSELAAEHEVLDLGYCGRHSYGVQACMAYGEKDVKTECFRAELMISQTISYSELMAKIESVNSRIRSRDEAEDAVEATEKKIRELQQQLETAKRTLEMFSK